jgi:hypothetical protein
MLLSLFPSPQSGQTAVLDFREGSAPGQKGDQAKSQQNGQGLEEVPAGVVEEEDGLDADDGTDEEAVRDGRVRQGFGEVVEVASEEEPLWLSV